MNKWQETALNKIGNVVSGGTPSTAISEFWDGDILFVTPNDLSKTVTPYIEDTQRKISKDGLANSSANILPVGSVVISSRAPIGYVAVGKKEFTTNQGCKSIIPNSNFDSLYLYYCFIFYVERIKKLGAGSTFAEISKADLESVKFPHPESLPEQRKIAQILSTTDSVIEKTQAAIAKYKAIKQGMLHDLFTRGIDVTTGKLRPKQQDAPELYKESKLGWIPKEWEIDEIGNRIECYSGGTPSRSRDEYFKGNIPWVSSSEVNQDEVKFTKENITEEALINSSAKWVKKNSVLVAMYGATAGQISMLRIDATTNQAVLACLDSDTIKTRLLYYLLIFYKERILYKAQGSGQPNLSKKIIDSIEIPIASINEQFLISEKLDSINNKLQSEQTYLQKLQMLKAGLMNDLLSGKKEVKLTDNN